MELTTIITSLLVCLFGSGGLVIWTLNRKAKKSDDTQKMHDKLENISKTLDVLQEGMKMMLENDKVIFSALRTHEINGESEEQERKMDKYFISLLGGK